MGRTANVIAGFLVLTLAGCVKQQGAKTQDSDQNATFAVVNGSEIKAKDVLPKIKDEVLQLRQQEYDLKRRATEEIIQQKILEDEAKKQGTTIEKLFTPFDSVLQNEVTKDDVKNFLASKGYDEKKITKEQKESIPQIIKMQRMYEARQNYVRQLREKAHVKFTIPRPEEPSLTVGSGSMAPLGGSHAKVTVVEFSDFECPYCFKARPIIEALHRNFGDKIKIVFRHFPLESLHPHAFHAAEAAVCANDQGKFWEYHNMLFDNQKLIGNDADLVRFAKELKMDDKAFSDCLNSDKPKATIHKDMEEGSKLGLNSTPTFFINGHIIRGAQPIDVFNDRIEDELQ